MCLHASARTLSQGPWGRCGPRPGCSRPSGARLLQRTLGSPRLSLLLPPGPGTPPPPRGDVPQSGQPTLPGLSLQSLVAHRVPLKPYAAPVPRSQSLQDQPTRNLAAFPASHEPDPAVPTPTAAPGTRGAVIRQNSDPTSEGPGPSPNPPSWVRPDTETPPKVRVGPRGRGNGRQTAWEGKGGE